MLGAILIVSGPTVVTPILAAARPGGAGGAAGTLVLWFLLKKLNPACLRGVIWPALALWPCSSW